MSLNFNIASKLDAAGFKEASAYLRTLTAETANNKKANQEHSVSVEGLEKAYSAFMGLAIIEFLRESVMVSIEAANQEEQLAMRVSQTGLSYARAKPALDGFFETLEAQSGVAREKLVPALEILIDKTHSVRESQQLMLTVMGLAKMRGIELSAAAEMVGSAYSQTGRGVAQVGQALGLTQNQMKDHALVMQILKERTEGFAKENAGAGLSVSKMANDLHGLKKATGDMLGTWATWASDVAGIVIRWATAMIMTFGNFYNTAAESALAGMRSIKNIWKNGLNEAGLTWISEQNAILVKFKATQDKAVELITGHNKEKGKLEDDYVGKTKKKYEDMNEEQLRLIAQGNAALNGNDQQRLAAKMKLIDAEVAMELTKLKQSKDYALVSDEDKERLELAIKKQGNAAKAKEQEAANKIMLNLFMQGSVQLGTALGKALAGEQDAWKKSLVAVIDMVAQQVEAIIAANTARDVSFLPGGLANPLAWGIIGQGVAQSAGVAALAAAADSAIMGGGGGGSSSAGVGGGSGGGVSAGAGAATASPAAAPAGQAPGQTLIVNVHGQLYGDPLVLQRLADKLSQAVLNNGVRLVATQIVPRA